MDLLEAHSGLTCKEACELLGVPWDYRVACTLVWNMGRPGWRRAAAFAQGAGAAQSAGDLAPEWGAALTETPEEAAALNARLNGDRMVARVRAERQNRRR